MPNPVSLSKQDRISFSKLREVEELPDLIEIQRKSYRDFLQRDVPPDERKNIGLQSVLRSFSNYRLRRGFQYRFYWLHLGDPSTILKSVKPQLAMRSSKNHSATTPKQEEQGPSEI